MDEFKPKQHPLKSELKKHGVSIATVANYLDLTYPYLLNMLNGTYKMQEQHEQRIETLLYGMKLDARQD
ncbi:MAG: hypothetical protein HUN04_00605 [Desulfobacter sp.]|nr:MAG: hypothetical protein HUN04_00605 [Desulfobacter sp.]